MHLKEETQFQYTGHAIRKRQFLRLLPEDSQMFHHEALDYATPLEVEIKYHRTQPVNTG